MLKSCSLVQVEKRNIKNYNFSQNENENDEDLWKKLTDVMEDSNHSLHHRLAVVWTTHS